MARKVLKICPPEETIVDIKHQMKCPLEDCDTIVSQTGQLHMHLVKIHGVIQNENDEYIFRRIKNGKQPNRLEIHYHCPVAKCIYDVLSERYFANISLLRQHYRKVHAEKKYQCEKCGSGFGMEKDKRAHEDRCGHLYRCATCDSPYRSIEAIMTHCKRKNHQLPEGVKKGTNKKSRQKTSPISETQNVIESDRSTPVPSNIFIVNVVQTLPQNTALSAEKLLKPILPKPLSVEVIPVTPVINGTTNKQVKGGNFLTNQSSAIHVQTQPITNGKTVDQSNLLKVDTSTGFVSTGTQVSQGSPRIRRGSVNLQKRRKSLIETSATSTGIQTSISTIPKKKKCLQNVAQTQTAGDFILKTAMVTADIPIQSESVGTQITPKVKYKHSRHKNMCSAETQTSNTASPRRRRRRKLYNEGYSVQTDSVCQTTDIASHLSVGTSWPELNKSVVHESAQTVVMVDENSQTVPHDLQNYCNSNNVNTSVNTGDVQGHRTQGYSVSSIASYTAADILQNISREILSTSVTNDEETLPNSENSPLNIISIPENDFGSMKSSVISQSTGTDDPELCCLKGISQSDDTNSASVAKVDISSTQTDQPVCNSSVQASLGDLDLLNTTWPVKDKSFSDTCYDRAETSVIASESTNIPVNNVPDTDLNLSHNIGVQTFESDLASFLMQCSLDFANASGKNMTTHVNLDSKQPVSYVDDSTQMQRTITTDGGALTVCDNSESYSLNSFSGAKPKSSLGSSTSEELNTSKDASVKMSATSSFSVQTDLTQTDYPSYPTVDMQVQTLSSASDIDQLLETVCSSMQTDDVYPLMNMHTQTVDDLDVLDLLMNNMETQTTDDMPFDGFSMADIQTQTTNEMNACFHCQATAATQTQSGTQNTSSNKSQGTHMETQTPFQGLLQFPMTDTHTQTTWQDLDEILSELNK